MFTTNNRPQDSPQDCSQKEFGVLSGVGEVTFDVNGGFLYGKIATSNALKGYTGKVTGGTGAFKGATGTIKTKTLNNKATKQAVTITYSTYQRTAIP